MTVLFLESFQESVLDWLNDIWFINEHPHANSMSNNFT